MADTTKKAQEKTEDLNKTDNSKGVKDQDGKNEGKVRVQLEPDEPKNFVKNLKDLQEKAGNLSRMSEKGIINEKTGAAIINREDGQLNMSASKYAQFKVNPNGTTTEIAMESTTISNRKKFKVDDIVINEHKLNPLLYEYTDMKQQKLPTNDHAIIGNFCIMGSVLVKAWEPNLKRYMMIRRPVRIPMFGTLLNVPEINTAYGIGDPLQLNETILAATDKGYQVNALIKDAKTLIKDANKDGYFDEGVDRPGINRGDTKDAGGGGGAGGGAGGGDGSIAVGDAPGVGRENIPSWAPDWTVELAMDCSEKLRIPCDWLWAHWMLETSFGAQDSDWKTWHNYGCVTVTSDMPGTEIKGHRWGMWDSDAEWSAYFARYVGKYFPAATKAKTLKEYVYAFEGQYCTSSTTEDYYQKIASALGNLGTDLNKRDDKKDDKDKKDGDSDKDKK